MKLGKRPALGINSGTEWLTLYVIAHMQILALNLLFCVVKLENNCNRN